MAPTGLRTPSQTGYDVVQAPRLSPQARQLWETLQGGSQGGVQAGLGQLSQLAGGGNEDFWRQLEAPAFRQFDELQGQIASRFSQASGSPRSPGALSARKSSSFQNATSGSAADLAERLQGQRLGLQQDAIKQLLGIYGGLIENDPYENFLEDRQGKGKSSWWRKLLEGGLPIIGGAVGSYFGGPIGGSIGGSIGSAAGRAFA